MSDTTSRPTPPWWLEAGFRFLERVGFPAAVTACLLWFLNGKMDMQTKTLAEIKTVLVERLPITNR